MTIRYSARSHIGRVRKNNEDNLYVDGVVLTQEIRELPFLIDGVLNQAAVFAVCDGMGGEEDGENASLFSVQGLAHIAGSIKEALPEQLDELVQTYADNVSKSLQAEPSTAHRRTGTTLALVVVAEGGIFSFNIGDSRIYSYRNETLEQITNDHTLIAEKIRRGIVNSNQAAEIKGGNKLTRCIGIGDDSIVESYPPIVGKSRILICSDGLTDMVCTSEIMNAMQLSGKTADTADRLLDMALKNGGRDNISIIVIEVEVRKKLFLGRLSKLFKVR